MMHYLLMILILSLFSTSYASQMKVIFVKPPVIAKRAGDEKPQALTKGGILKEGDRVQVKDEGLLVLRELEGGSTVKLESGALFEVTKLKTTKEGKSRSLYSLARGAAFFFTPKDKKGEEKLKVRTLGASFAVRGTEFFISYGKKKGSQSDIWMCVNEGIVETSSEKSSKPILVKAGEGIQIDMKGQISPPKPLPWTRRLNWNSDPKSGDLKNHVSIEEAYASPLEMDFD